MPPVETPSKTESEDPLQPVSAMLTIAPTMESLKFIISPIITEYFFLIY
ncbi:hypothetical protein P3TCK_08918 [Photobacterium profundum 3TCK]|uniref:Uncharacterized protein n=1 Tax=Photobacterium profundum 3TCK TaxID=314280 RepID=Q1YYE1_9GAMM|nr:hypothetical protein P3TCK_08918 [Photobacterium profundum 3TCK]